MGKDKSIVKVSTSSLERVSKQISIVDKILSKRQARIFITKSTPEAILDELRILPTRSTPEVILNTEGIIRLRGRSIPDDALYFFKPIEEWISEYIGNPADVTCVEINLEIINADSKKFLLHIFQKITYVTLKHKKFIINWYYDDSDEDILEIGEHIASLLDVPFTFIRMI